MVFSILVVGGAQVLIGEDLVCFTDLLELFVGGGVVGVLVCW